MKDLIITMAVGDTSKKYSRYTFPLIMQYAQKCGADFKAVHTLNPSYTHIGYQKWDYVKLLDSYDRILHIDADMIVKTNTPNLFDLHEPGKLAGVNELPFQDLVWEYPAIDRLEDMNQLGKIDGHFYINAGLYLFDKKAYTSNVFDRPYDPNSPCHYKEQSHLNYNLHTKKINAQLLSPQFNFMSLMEHKGLKVEDAYIIHYAGAWGKGEEWVLNEMRKYQ